MRLSAILFFRFTFRHWRKEWRQTLLLVCMIGLGVGGWLAIQMANRASLGGFVFFNEALSGQSDWVVVAKDGRLSDSDLPEILLAVAGLGAEVVPVVESSAALLLEDTDTDFYGLRVIGMDLVALQNLPGVAASTVGDVLGDREVAAWASIARNPRATFPVRELGAKFGWQPGDTFAVLVNDQVLNWQVEGLIGAGEGELPPPVNLVLMDLPALRAALGEVDRIDRVEVVLHPGDDLADRVVRAGERLRRAGENRWHVETPEETAEAQKGMTAALRLNLTVLSLISLLVALYLITQAMDGAVVRRRGEIATLRSLGVSRGRIARIWAMEMVLLGAAGGLCGIVIGWALSHLSVSLVTRTVETLYREVAVTSLGLPWWQALGALALGLLGGLVAGIFPIRDAVQTPPAQVLARGNWSPGFRVFDRPEVAVLLVVIGGLLLLLPLWRTVDARAIPVGAYATAFLWITAAALFFGGLGRPIGGLLGRFGSSRVAWRLACRRLFRSGSRPRIAVAGLVVAMGMAVGMTLLVGSFDRTLRQWIEVRFKADLYITSAGAVGAQTDNRVRPETIAALREFPGVREVDPYHAVSLRWRDGIIYLGSYRDTGNLDDLEMLFISGPRGGGGSVEGALPLLVSESLARRFGLSVGEVVELPLREPMRKGRVAAIYADFTNDRGTLLLPRQAFIEATGEDRAVNLGVYLNEGVDPEQAAAGLRSVHPGLDIRTNPGLRGAILRIFRQTFAVTDALKGIAVSVALIGLGLSLLTMARESRAEWQTLRSLGVSRRSLSLSFAIEGAGLATAGGIGGSLLGLGLGWLLIYRINLPSFGWTLQFHFNTGEWLMQMFGLMVLGGLAGAWAGLRTARSFPAKSSG